MEECLICKAPLAYLAEEAPMECAICRKEEMSRTHCVNGHYVCSSCHTSGVDSIIGICLNEASSDPIAILNRLMALPFCHMHGPEHHMMAGAALLTACRNAGFELDLAAALKEMLSRGKEIPGGACGFWGACGAGISTGIFFSILTKTTPLSGKTWGLGNRMTASALAAIGKIGGPRCCKRNSYLALLAAVDFLREHMGIELERSVPACTHSHKNKQCLGTRCPFSGSE